MQRTASCACGNLTVTVAGDPADVYLCSCASCQKRSGGVFTYAAHFPEASVTVAGYYKTWARAADSGRLIETSFCPNCGVTAFFQAEGLPGLIGVPVGCFTDPEFAKPSRLYWASRRHHWLNLCDIPEVDTQ